MKGDLFASFIIIDSHILLHISIGFWKMLCIYFVFAFAEKLIALPNRTNTNTSMTVLFIYVCVRINRLTYTWCSVFKHLLFGMHLLG